MNFIQRAQQKELSFTELLTLTKEYFISNPGRIISQMILFMLPIIGIGILLAVVGFSIFLTTMAGSASTDLSGLSRDVGMLFFPMIIVAVLCIMLLQSWYFGSTMNWLYKDTSEEGPTFKESAKLGLRRTLLIFGTQLLTGIIIGLTAFLLIFIFGFLFSMIFGLATKPTLDFMNSTFEPHMLFGLIMMFISILLGVVAVLFLGNYLIFSQHVAALKEKTGPWRAVKRSMHLVKGRFWRIFGRILFVNILVIATDTILQTIVGIFNEIHMGLGSLAWLAYVAIMFCLGIASTIYMFFLYISIDSSKPENKELGNS